MKLDAIARAAAPSRCFAAPSLRKYYLCDATHVGQAVRRFRDNRKHYTAEQRKKWGDAIAVAYMKFHFRGLSAAERKLLVPRTRKALGI